MIGYQEVLKPLLFLLDAENAHQISAGALKLAARFSPQLLEKLFTATALTGQSKELAGIRFPNPIGLAAGFDKNAELVDAMACLGFGFVEIGTVTPLPQPGNPKPRLFRLPLDQAIINRMGFNNEGVEAAAKRLSQRKNHRIVVGGNIGKNKDTPNEEAWRDYIKCFRVLAPEVAYITLNMSSPNTAGLRQLLEKESLQAILEPVQNENQKRSNPIPLFVKLSPDMAPEGIAKAVEVCLDMKISGLIATNTTISRDNLTTTPKEIERIGAGGLSGSPLTRRATDALQAVKSLANHRLSLISSGGIMTPGDVETRLIHGADLVQLYTGLIYYGPGLVTDSLRRIARTAAATY